MAFQSTMGQVLWVLVKEYPVQAEVGMGVPGTVVAHCGLCQKLPTTGQTDDLQSNNKP
jgi:hypothetical protein